MIQDLIKHVEYQKIDDIFTSLDKCDHLIMVSDGSGKYYAIRTFAWVLSSPDKKRLATAAGHCYSRESSLRAEATGILSASVSMAMIQHHRQKSQSMINSFPGKLDLVSTLRGIKTKNLYEELTSNSIRFELFRIRYNNDDNGIIGTN